MKTELAVDFTTICGLTRLGKQCAYCYVGVNRECGGLFAKIETDRERYDGWVLRLRGEMREKLQAGGGLRLFGSGDYLPEHREDMQQLLDDCVTVGLKARALTKSLVFVSHFAKHPAIRVISLGIDGLPRTMNRSPVTWKTAQRLRDKHDVVQVRAVVCYAEELDRMAAEPWIDVLTLYHGPKTEHGFHHFTRQEYEAAVKKYGVERFCSTHQECSTCSAKCGKGC